MPSVAQLQAGEQSEQTNRQKRSSHTPEEGVCSRDRLLVSTLLLQLGSTSFEWWVSVLPMPRLPSCLSWTMWWDLSCKDAWLSLWTMYWCLVHHGESTFNIWTVSFQLWKKRSCFAMRQSASSLFKKSGFWGILSLVKRSRQIQRSCQLLPSGRFHDQWRMSGSSLASLIISDALSRGIRPCPDLSSCSQANTQSSPGKQTIKKHLSSWELDCLKHQFLVWQIWNDTSLRLTSDYRN